MITKEKFYQLLKTRRCSHVIGQTETQLCIIKIRFRRRKKIWFIISTEQREYRASAMQWTCETYQSLGYMKMFLFKGWKWRANGRKPKQKTSVQNPVFLSSIHIEDSTMKEHLAPQFDIFVGQSTSYTLRGYPF